MKEFKISCPHCQQHIAFPESSHGKVIPCPSCGLSVGLNVPGYNPPLKPQTVHIKQQAKTGCVTQFLAVLLILGLVLFVLSLFVSPPATAPSQDSPSAEAKPDIHATIHVLGNFVIVSNTGTNEWKWAKLFVNSNPPFGYECRIENIKPLDSKAIPLTEFTDDNGKRFDPHAYKLMFVWIAAEGTDYHKFAF